MVVLGELVVLEVMMVVLAMVMVLVVLAVVLMVVVLLRWCWWWCRCGGGGGCFSPLRCDNMTPPMSPWQPAYPQKSEGGRRAMRHAFNQMFQ